MIYKKKKLCCFWFLPEVRGKLEAVAHIIPPLSEVGRVDGNKNGLVARCLCAANQGQRQLSVLVDVKLHPQHPSIARHAHFFYGGRGPGAQHHPRLHLFACWVETTIRYSKFLLQMSAWHRFSWSRGHIIPPGVSVISRYKPFWKICLFWHHKWACPPRCMRDRWAAFATVYWVGW